MYDPISDYRLEDWDAITSNDSFQELNGPIMRSRAFCPTAEEYVRLGFMVVDKSCNASGVCHGGMIATLLDIALGMNAIAASDGRQTPTMSFTVDFAQPARAGDWVESRVRIIRRTRRTVFCDGLLVIAAGVIARGSGVFKIPSGTR